MALTLYDRSSGEIRARAYDESETPLTNATLTCTLVDGHLHPHTIFTSRAMAYSGSHPYTDTNDLGCYFCTVSATELTGPDGLWKATITATDAQGHVLVTDAYIDVQPFTAE